MRALDSGMFEGGFQVFLSCLGGKFQRVLDLLGNFAQDVDEGGQVLVSVTPKQVLQPCLGRSQRIFELFGQPLEHPLDACNVAG